MMFFQPAEDVISTLTQYSIIWADQDDPRPPLPYISLRVMREREQQHPYEAPVDANGNQESSTDSACVVEIQAYGPNAYGIMKSLRASLGFQSTGDQLAGTGISIMHRGDVMNITELLNNTFHEERAAVEVIFGYRFSATDNVGVISTVTGLNNLGITT